VRIGETSKGFEKDTSMFPVAVNIFPDSENMEKEK
jgi:hypothetical protein